MITAFQALSKPARKTYLFELAERALRDEGWTIQRIPRCRKHGLRQILRNGETLTVAIRTSQDTAVAFPRKADDTGWETLDDADLVLVATVDVKDDPKSCLVFQFDGAEMRRRFDASYRARLDAGHSVPLERGIWLQMFIPEDKSVATRVGGGLAIGKRPILWEQIGTRQQMPPLEEPKSHTSQEMLTVAEAKKRLAATLNVDVDQVKIVIEA